MTEQLQTAQGDSNLPAPLPTPTTGRTASFWRGLLQWSLLAVLFLSFLYLPQNASNFSHDSGSHMATEFYAQQHYLFGENVIQNTGPYGYLQYLQDYSGILSGRKFVFAFAFAAILALLVVRSIRYFSTPFGKVLVVATMLGAPPPFELYLDATFYVFLLLAAHHLLTRRYYRSNPILDVIVLGFVALQCLTKNTSLILGALLILMVAAQDIFYRQWRRLALDAGAFTLATAALWFLAAQQWSNIIPFLRGSFMFSQGYNEAMELAGEPVFVWMALIVMALLAAINIQRLVNRAWWRLPLMIWEAACFFIIWKHSYVRADRWHIEYFWSFLVAACPILFLAHEKFDPQSASTPENSIAARPKKSWSFYPAKLARLAMIGCLACSRVTFYLTGSSIYISHIPINLRNLATWRTFRANLDEAVAQNRQYSEMPLIRQAVGFAPIDQFSYLPGDVLMNGLNYDPRPMPITFAAVTDPLMQRNAQFYRDDATAPPFVMAQINDFVHHFNPQDDSLALLELLLHYKPLFVERGMLLLQRRPGPAWVPLRSTPAKTKAQWDQFIILPKIPNRYIWCSVDIQYSLLGKIRTFLYRPPEVRIELSRGDLRISSSRFLVCAGPTGFLANPIILNNDDLTMAMSPGPPLPKATLQPDRIRFVTDDDCRNCFKNDIRVSCWVIQKAP